MIMSSTHGINDLGVYDMCNRDTHGIGNFMVLKANLTTMPISFNFGFCIPKQCDDDQITSM